MQLGLTRRHLLGSGKTGAAGDLWVIVCLSGVCALEVTGNTRPAAAGLRSQRL